MKPSRNREATIKAFQDALGDLYAACGTFGLANMAACRDVVYTAQAEIENRYCAFDPTSYRTWMHRFYREYDAGKAEPCDAWVEGEYGEWDEA